MYKTVIPRIRLEEMATKFKDIILELDDTLGRERIYEELDLTDEEAEWLELNETEEDEWDVY